MGERKEILRELRRFEHYVTEWPIVGSARLCEKKLTRVDVTIVLIIFFFNLDDRSAGMDRSIAIGSLAIPDNIMIRICTQDP